jgi:hypothetical protein
MRGATRELTQLRRNVATTHPCRPRHPSVTRLQRPRRAPSATIRGIRGRTAHRPLGAPSLHPRTIVFRDTGTRYRWQPVISDGDRLALDAAQWLNPSSSCNGGAGIHR